MIGQLRNFVTRAKAKARAERDAALAALRQAEKRRDTRQIHEARERATAATARALRLGV